METSGTIDAAPRRRSSIVAIRGFMSGLCSSKKVKAGFASDPPDAPPRDARSIASSARRDYSSDVTLTTAQKDCVFRYQMDFRNPKPLGPYVFYVAGLVGNINNSPRILESLKAFSILSHHAEDPTVYTGRINRQFTHQLPFLSLNSQRMLIALLFYWEEELARWTDLELEALNIEEEIRETEEQKQELDDESVQMDHHKAIRTTLCARIEELTVQRTRLRTLYSMAPSMRGGRIPHTDEALSQATSISSKSTHLREPTEGSWRQPSFTRGEAPQRPIAVNSTIDINRS